MEAIKEEKLRNITFNKRKLGLLKKATEISLLCNIKVVLFFTDLNDNLCKLVSPNEEDIDIINMWEQFKILNYKPEYYPSFRLKSRKERCDKNKPRVARSLRKLLDKNGATTTSKQHSGYNSQTPQ